MKKSSSSVGQAATNGSAQITSVTSKREKTSVPRGCAETPIEEALRLAEAGIAIFPCKPDKSPLTNHGFKDASTNLGQIHTWWANHPDGLLGVPTGPVNKLVVIDFDPSDSVGDLEAMLKRFTERFGEIPPTRSIKTPSGGLHLYFTYGGTAHIKSRRGTPLGPGIDVRAEGGYVVAPPSVASHGSYTIDTNAPMAPLPKALAAALTEGEHEGALERTTSRPDKPANSAVTEHDIRSALNRISAEDYDIWIQVGMGLQHWDLEAGYLLWKEWSRKASNYNETDLERHWKTFDGTKNPNVTIATILAMAKNSTMAASSEIPTLYYDEQKKTYWLLRKNASYIEFPENSARRLLKDAGLSSAEVDGANSPIAAELLRIQLNHRVAIATPLAGHQPGLNRINQRDVLVTTGPSLVTPAPGSFPLFEELLAGMLKGDVDQRCYLYGWLKVYLEGLYTGNHKPGQLLVIAGPAGSYKSFLQSIITEVFGGRSAKPYRYMTGATAFNSDLIGAEHQIIEDEIPLSDFSARRAFGAKIKDFTVNQTQSAHGKGKEALSLIPKWRVSLTVNDEPENLSILPPFDESLSDKIILLKSYANHTPEFLARASKPDFKEEIIKELPAIAYFLHTYVIPQEQQSTRYGIAAWHHPELLDAIEQQSPEYQLLTLMDTYLWRINRDTWHGSSTDLIECLTASDCPGYRTMAKSFGSPSRVGLYLARLAKRYPTRLTFSRNGHDRTWTIYKPRSSGTSTSHPAGNVLTLPLSANEREKPSQGTAL